MRVTARTRVHGLSSTPPNGKAAAAAASCSDRVPSVSLSLSLGRSFTLALSTGFAPCFSVLGRDAWKAEKIKKNAAVFRQTKSKEFAIYVYIYIYRTSIGFLNFK